MKFPATLFDQNRQERSLILLPSIPGEELLKQTEFTTYERRTKNSCLRNFSQTKNIKGMIRFTFIGLVFSAQKECYT